MGKTGFGRLLFRVRGEAEAVHVKLLARDVVHRRCDDECVLSVVHQVRRFCLRVGPSSVFSPRQAQTDVRSSEVFSGCSFLCKRDVVEQTADV